MKNAAMLKLVVLLFFVAGLTANAGNVKSAGVYGKWSATATWVGGALPGPTDTVTIANGDTVTYDMLWTANHTIAGLIVGEGTSGILQFSNIDSTKMTINGDLLIKKGAIFKALTKTTAVLNVLGNQHLIVVTGNLTYQGAIITARSGSAGSTLSVINFEFAGSTNTTITIAPDTSTWIPNISLNGLKINKSGNARVTLNSNVYCASGSSNAPYHTALLTFVKGKVYTGNYVLATQTSTNANFSGASDSSYVVGAMGRANASGGANREWFIGDSKGFRPVKIRMTTGLATGHTVIVRALEGNANTGSSTLSGGIDKVAASRYYKLDYFKGTLSTTTIKIDRFSVGYGLNDGIADSSRNLRIAYSTDNRASWIGLGPVLVPDTAIFAKVAPRYLTSDSLAPTSNLTLTDSASAGTSIYFAFARATGTTDNTLVGTGTSIERVTSSVPERFALSQNYPNPFNPSTRLRFQIAKAGFVSLKIYDLLGREIATLVNESLPPGSYSTQWNPLGFGSGVYVYRLESGGLSESRKMIFMK
jgi:hypothetical protein